MNLMSKRNSIILQMRHLEVFSISAMLVVLVFVFTATANQADKHVTEMVHKSKHASEDHHDAAGKVDDVKTLVARLYL
ncbi:hypothetical protein DAPPUDRAFT_243680 [Daphnia pulex]|uniref:Uncharacterized protein n=1 Tax=Daphnia pulex TaxID=6669 RepID=E9GJD6_DAPPU|nr:hypothetical protein DAPPUDRAFT_243680 [Daphnia pulex]|eukprot:EFX80508.1 hypothetical protein DAPPUDRAFT_243680 [Daphnia pulex]